MFRLYYAPGTCALATHIALEEAGAQMLFLLNHGCRVIAHDRRGHGRSTQVSDGHDMDHYADDLAAMTAHLDLKNAIHVGHSTGGGEVARYIGRHGESRVAKAALISAVRRTGRAAMYRRGSLSGPHGLTRAVARDAGDRGADHLPRRREALSQCDFFSVLAPPRVERAFRVQTAVGVGAEIVAQTL